MKILLVTLHILAAFVLIAVVLLQHGKGADIGATFGGGSSQTVFGSRGAGNFLTKMTTLFVVVFMGTSISLAYLTTPRSVLEGIEIPEAAPVEQPAESPDATPIDDSVPGGFESVPSGEATATEGSTSEAPAGFESVPNPEDPAERAPASEADEPTAATPPPATGSEADESR